MTLDHARPAPAPHPWNTGFVWEDHRGPFRRLTEEQAAAFDRDGCVVIDDLVDPAELADVVAEIDAFDAQTEAFLDTFEGGRLSIAEKGAINFSIHLVTRSSRLAALARHPAIVELCADLLGPDVNLYWDQAVYKLPDKPRRFPWHQDNGYTFVEPQQYLTVWLALTDATIDNGCPQIAPGLHRGGTLVHHYVDPLGWECLTDPEHVVITPVRAGGAAVFSSLTPHLTGPNLSGATRKAYILQYAPVGATILRGDPQAGPPSERQLADDPARQFPILLGGVPV